MMNWPRGLWLRSLMVAISILVLVFLFSGLAVETLSSASVFASAAYRLTSLQSDHKTSRSPYEPLDVWSEELEGYYVVPAWWTNATKQNVTRRHRRRPINSTRTNITRRTRTPTIATHAPTRDRTFIPSDLPDNLLDVVEDANYCDRELKQHTHPPSQLRADCGTQYTLPGQVDGLASHSLEKSLAALQYNKTRDRERPRRSWQVVFVGEEWSLDSPLRRLSGCPHECPLSDQCQLLYDSEWVSHNTERVNVAVVTSPQYLEIRRAVHPTAEYKVIYWRESTWSGPPVAFQKSSRMFSFEMGVHMQSYILNPTFLPRPRELLLGYDRALRGHGDIRLENGEQRGVNSSQEQSPIEAEQDTSPGDVGDTGSHRLLETQEESYFAASVISDCQARSKRDEYLRAVMQVLSPLKRKVHRFGSCGDRDLPGRGITDALRILSKYKFFFAMENSLQPGYVTEKLFSALMLPETVPIYYGSPESILNITTLPSFIRASDFATPQDLAQYLLMLDENEGERRVYLKWKSVKQPFTQFYLDLVASKVPGPAEVLAHAGSFRSAACCRLCNSNFVSRSRELRRKDVLVMPALTGTEAFDLMVEPKQRSDDDFADATADEMNVDNELDAYDR